MTTKAPSCKYKHQKELYYKQFSCGFLIHLS